MPEFTDTARALLRRHGLPEHVINDALHIHGQELAAKVRNTELPSWADSLDLFDNGSAWAADLVDPAVPDALAGTANADAHRGKLPSTPHCQFAEGCHRVVACDPGCAVSAAALRDRIADVLRPHASLGGTPLRYEMPLFDGATPSLPRISGWWPLDDVVAALAAVLPEPDTHTTRAAVLAEAADWLKAWRPEFFERWAIAEQESYEVGIEDAAAELRRLDGAGARREAGRG